MPETYTRYNAVGKYHDGRLRDEVCRFSNSSTLHGKFQFIAGVKERVLTRDEAENQCRAWNMKSGPCRFWPYDPATDHRSRLVIDCETTIVHLPCCSEAAVKSAALAVLGVDLGIDEYV